MEVERDIKSMSSSTPTPITVTLIYIENPHLTRSYKKKRWGFSKNLKNKFIHRDFIPNNLLEQLHKEKKIVLSTVALPLKEKYDVEDIQNIPSADVWIFSLLSYIPSLPFDESFYKVIKDRSMKDAIKLINLTSHVGLANKEPSVYPRITKRKENGLTSIHDSESYAILQNDQAQKEWERKTGEKWKAKYVMEELLSHKLNSTFQPFYCIERLVYICGDLTIGIRVSPHLIIKQTNSVTSYMRDPRLLKSEFDLLCTIAPSNPKNGSLPITFCYSGDASFWDRRYKCIADFAQGRNLEIGTFDVIEDKEKNLHIIDYNEHTWEKAHTDLFSLWVRALYRGIEKKYVH